MNKRVLVAMSGGVDSSVTAALLKTQGFEVLGVHMQMSSATPASLGGSCSINFNSSVAKKVCESLEIPFYTVDSQEEFKSEVIDYMIHEALQGRSPNPCSRCSTKVKFRHLLKKADELRCNLVATGHYAKVVKNADGSETNLYRAIDRSEDQS